MLRSKASEVFPRAEWALEGDGEPTFLPPPPGHHRHCLPPVWESQALPSPFSDGPLLFFTLTIGLWGQGCQQHNGRPFLPASTTYPLRGREGNHHTRYHRHLLSLPHWAIMSSPCCLAGLGEELDERPPTERPCSA